MVPKTIPGTNESLISPRTHQLVSIGTVLVALCDLEVATVFQGSDCFYDSCFAPPQVGFDPVLGRPGQAVAIGVSPDGLVNLPHHRLHAAGFLGDKQEGFWNAVWKGCAGPSGGGWWLLGKAVKGQMVLERR